MKKTSQTAKTVGPPAEARPEGTEVFPAPPPPSKGRVIGLDCHPDTFTAAVFRGATPHDARKLASRENLSLERLLAWAGSEFDREDLFVMEAGTNSFEIHNRLLALGLRAAVLESAHVGRQAKRYADNDKMAAARIVLVYLAGDAPCVWVPDDTTRQRRELLHIYRNAVDDHTAATNSLKSYLTGFGIRLGSRGPGRPATREWILRQRDWAPLQRELLEDYFQTLDSREARRKQLTRLIGREVCSEPLMLRVMKLLGIGMINAFGLLAVIGDVRRFEHPGKLVAYLGLNPGQRVSGRQKRVKIGIGKRGRGDVRHLLIQAAQAVLRAGRHTPLGKWGWKLFARKGNRNVAVAAVARKLLVQAWHLLAGNPPTALEPDKTFELKLAKLVVTLGKSLRAKLQLPSTISESVRYLRNSIILNTQPNTP